MLRIVRLAVETITFSRWYSGRLFPIVSYACFSSEFCSSFHPKLGVRTMRDAVEKLMGDTVAECMLEARVACGVLEVDETHNFLIIR